MALGELAVLRNDTKLFLPRESRIPQLVPTLVELSLVLVGPFLGNMMRRVRGARRKVCKERLVGSEHLLLADPLDRLGGQVIGEMIALLGVFLCSTGVVPSYSAGYHWLVSPPIKP